MSVSALFGKCFGDRFFRRRLLFYAGVCLAVLPVVVFRDFTPSNELRYLSIADEALRQGRFFAFTNHGTPYADKPPLYLWAVMALRRIGGGHRMWLLSLLSLLPALGVVGVMERWVAGADGGVGMGAGGGLPGGGDGCVGMGADGGLPGGGDVGLSGTLLCDGGVSAAGLMLATCGLFLGAAVFLRMDMLMCFFIVLSLREFWRIRESGGGRWLFPLWLFLALFTKGPYGLLIPLAGTTAFLAVSGEIRSFFRYWGWRTWLALALLCGLWFGAVWFEGGREYLENLLVHQTVGRAVNSFHHKAPFYYYAVSFWYTLAPWSILVAVGVVMAFLRGGAGRRDLQRFFLCVGLSSFAALSCVSSKLEIYLLPAFPFLVYGAAMSLPGFCGRFSEDRASSDPGVAAEHPVGRRRGEDLWGRIAVGVPAAVFVLAVPALLVAEAKAGVPYLDNFLVYCAAGVLTLTGVNTLCLLFGRVRGTGGPIRRTGLDGGARSLAVGLLLAVFTAGWAVPELNPWIGYGELCSEAMKLSEERGVTDIRAWHVRRAENMDVYLHRDITVIPGDAFPPTRTEASTPGGTDIGPGVSTEASTPSVTEAGRQPYILLTKAEYAELFPDFETHVTGPYAVILIN